MRLGKWWIALLMGWVQWACGTLQAQVDSTQSVTADSISPAKPKLVFSGYVDVCFASATDSASVGPFVKFLATGARPNQFGLNMAYFGAKYTHEKVRFAAGLHVGDIAATTWSPVLNMVQEANAGVRLRKRWWVDAGFFRTHIGLESIQPRENICQSTALADFFEPFYFSGAKLTFQATARLSVQLGVYNGFSTFIDTNRDKAVGLSLAYTFGDGSTLSYNALTADETPDAAPRSRRILYHDAYYLHTGKRFDIGGEANWGLQRASQLDDSLGTAQAMSGFVVARYKLGKYAAYGRAELVLDPDGILSGAQVNGAGDAVGVRLAGLTLGLEVRPVDFAFVRAEGRYLRSIDGEDIFVWQGQPAPSRLEGQLALGAWF